MNETVAEGTLAVVTGISQISHLTCGVVVSRYRQSRYDFPSTSPPVVN